MALNVGARLGHYSVTALLGEGGMGQVWQATDTQLNREVALKILPDAFAADPDRLARFQREAQVLASLNHPNIAAIYGIEESEGTRALVLELVEGPTLADRIAQGAMPIEDALPLAKQIAEALEAAHEAGVIHRDLKPANIKVREDGTVKVLDFGLAKALDPSPTSDPSQSPTLTAAATQMGVIMGTAAYMSPEQARGKTVDKRADIWAFGAVLYEMLTGKRAFEGDDVSLTLSVVLQREPPWEALPGSVPPGLLTYLRRCLQKDPLQRVQAIGDVRLAVEGAFEPHPSEPAESVATGTGRSRTSSVATGALLGGVVVGLVAWIILGGEPARSPTTTRFSLSLPSGDVVTPLDGVTVSPSGDRIVYGATRDGVQQLFVRARDQLEALPIPGTEGGRSPFFSPNGEWVGYFTGSALMKVSLSGGPPFRLATVGVQNGATWGPADTIVYSYSSAGLLEISANGGESRELTTIESNESHVWPAFAPDGASVFFTISTGGGITGDKQVALLSLATGEYEVIVDGTGPRMSPTGHLVFGREDSLWAVPFDLSRMEMTDDARPIVDGVQVNTPGGWTHYGVAQDGTLVYVASSEATGNRRALVWVDREGRAEPVNAPPAQYEALRLSPDGRQVAVQVDDTNDTHVRVIDLQRGTSTRLTFGDAADDGNPIWTPDGARIVFSSGRGGNAPNLYWKASDGTGQAQRLTTSENPQTPMSWSADGELVFHELRGEGSANIGMISLSDTDQPTWIMETEFSEVHPEVSPDGRWLAYSSNESGQSEIYVRPFPNVEGGKWLVSRGGGQTPAWGPSGTELFLRTLAGQRSMMVVEVETDPTFNPRTAREVFADSRYLMLTAARRGRSFDIDPGGERFLMITDPRLQELGNAVSAPITVVLDWFEELQRRVPTP